MKRKPSPQSVYHAEKARVNRQPIVSHAQLMAEAKAEYDRLIESDRAARKGGRPKKQPARPDEASVVEMPPAPVAAAPEPSHTHAQLAAQPAKPPAKRPAAERAPARGTSRSTSSRGASGRSSTRSTTRSTSTARRGAKNGRQRRTGRAS